MVAMNFADIDQGDVERVTKDGAPLLAQALLDENMPTGDFHTLAALWKRTIISVTCKLPNTWEDGFWMGHAVRGAWGHSLPRLEQETNHHWRSLLPSHVLLDTHVKIGSNHVPQPYVFNVWRHNNELKIELVLFGFANIYREICFRALIAALETGVSIAPSSGVRAPWEILEAHWTQESTYRNEGSQRDGKTQAFIVFETPYKYSSANNNLTNSQRALENIVMAAIMRVKGMGRWCGMRISQDNLTLKEQIKHFHIKEMPYSRWLAFQRNSSRGDGFRHRDLGTLNMLEVSLFDDDITQGLHLATTTNIGPNADMGFGRFMLI